MALMARHYCASDILALLLGHRSDAREHCSANACDCRGVTDDEHIGMTRHRKIGTHLDPAGAVDVGAEPTARRRRHNASSPDNGPCWNKFVAEPHAVAAAVGDSRPKAHIDTELIERTSGCI